MGVVGNYGDPDPPGDDDGGPLPLGALHLSLHHRTHVHHHPSRISNMGLLFLYILRRQNNLVKFGNSWGGRLGITMDYAPPLKGPCLPIVLFMSIYIPTCLMDHCEGQEGLLVLLFRYLPHRSYPLCIIVYYCWCMLGVMVLVVKDMVVAKDMVNNLWLGW